mmetsp:Transcript_30722/g.68057  ORF Transcript_30722/g.68057 Transcript_30722/m.68057 type:complete len:227 (-) Transcript_30722:891-1571(-)
MSSRTGVPWISSKASVCLTVPAVLHTSMRLSAALKMESFWMAMAREVVSNEPLSTTSLVSVTLNRSPRVPSYTSIIPLLMSRPRICILVVSLPGARMLPCWSGSTLSTTSRSTPVWMTTWLSRKRWFSRVLRHALTPSGDTTAMSRGLGPHSMDKARFPTWKAGCCSQHRAKSSTGSPSLLGALYLNTVTRPSAVPAASKPHRRSDARQTMRVTLPVPSAASSVST